MRVVFDVFEIRLISSYASEESKSFVGKEFVEFALFY